MAMSNNSNNDIEEGPSQSNARRCRKETLEPSESTRESIDTISSSAKIHGKGKGRAVCLDPTESVDSNHEAETAKSDNPAVVTTDGSSGIRRVYFRPRPEAMIKVLGGKVWFESLDYFFSRILPPIRLDLDVDRILKQCITNKTLRTNRRTKKYSWTFAPKKNGRRTSTKSCNNFLKNIFDTIIETALEQVKSPKPSPTCYLYSHGQHSLWPTADSNISADATLFLSSTDDTYPEEYEGRHWYNSAFSILIRKSESDDSEYIEQMLQCLHHPMVIDPCRRFTLGASIDNTRMRLWLYSRSTIICSEEFDFYSDAETMIRIVFSLMFSDKIDLGWDPTVDAKYDGHQRIFEYEVSGKRFRTGSTDVLSESKVEGIYTSATRIYKAYHAEERKGKEPVIIKDFWPGEECNTEDVMRQMILDDISSPSEKEIVRRMTLTPISYGRVRVGDREDHTERTILRGEGPRKRYRVTLPYRRVNNDNNSLIWESEGCEKKTSSKDEEEERILKEKRRKAYYYRWHYRIVYKEYAVPYDKLQNLDDMYLVLVCAIEVLSVIHKAGWVHRDISPGNLYLYIDPSTGEKRGLVGDLEFAKRVGGTGKRDGRTGTPNFMAVEIMMQKYRFPPRKPPQGSDHQSDYNSDEYDTIFENALVPEDEDDSEIKYTSICEQGIWANYLHDLESILWIAIWTLFNFESASMATPKSEKAKTIRKSQSFVSNLLFSGYIDYRDRMSFLFDNERFKRTLQRVSSQLKGLKAIIILIRNLLVSSYEKAEEKGIEYILPTDENPVHLHILEYFKRIPRHGIKVRKIWKIKEDRVSETRSKRTIIDTKDDEQQPSMSERSIQEAGGVESSSAEIFTVKQDVNEEPREKTRGMTLRSDLKCKQKNMNNRRAHVVGRKAVGRTKRTVKEKVLVVNENQRMTRSMAKKLSLMAATNTVKTRAGGLNAKTKSSKPRK